MLQSIDYIKEVLPKDIWFKTEVQYLQPYTELNQYCSNYLNILPQLTDTKKISTINYLSTIMYDTPTYYSKRF